MSTRRATIAGMLGALSLALCPAEGHAHGPAAAITGVVLADASGPRLLRTTEGLALRSADQWTFLCPARFGLSTTPLAVSTDPDAWVVGQSGGTLWTPSGWSTLGTEALSAAKVIAFARSTRAQYALTYDSASSEVLSLSSAGARSLFRTAEPWLSIASDGEALWLARFDGVFVETMRADEQGVEAGRVRHTLRASARTLQLRALGARVFLHITFDDGAELRELGVAGEPTVARYERAILGPVTGDDGKVWLGMGTELVLMGGTGQATDRVPLASSSLCLEEALGVPYVCLQTEVHRLSDALSGNFAAPLARLAELRAPSADTLASGDADSCSAQWLTFQADMVRAGIVSPGEPATADDGAADAGAPALADASPPPIVAGEAPAGEGSPQAQDAGLGASTRDAASDPAEADLPSRMDDGCSVAGTRPPVRSLSRFGSLGLAALVALRVRRRRRASSVVFGIARHEG